MAQIREYIDLADEYGLAYESLASILEIYPFTVSGKAAVALLEVGLLFRYKTDRPQDSGFDTRTKQ